MADVGMTLFVTFVILLTLVIMTFTGIYLYSIITGKEMSLSTMFGSKSSSGSKGTSTAGSSTSGASTPGASTPPPPTRAPPDTAPWLPIIKTSSTPPPSFGNIPNSPYPILYGCNSVGAPCDQIGQLCLHILDQCRATGTNCTDPKSEFYVCGTNSTSIDNGPGTASNVRCKVDPSISNNTKGCWQQNPITTGPISDTDWNNYQKYIDSIDNKKLY